MNFKCILISLITLIQVTFSKAQPIKAGEQLNVWAIKGLALKQQPAFSAKTLLTIAYGKPVKVIGDKSFGAATMPVKNSALLKSLKGNWIKVSYQGKQGYVFDAYLLKMPPFIMDRYGVSESDEDYLKRNYGIARTSKVKGKDEYEKTTTNYKNGNISISSVFDGCVDTELYLKGLTHQQATVFMEPLFSNDNNFPMEELKIIKLKEAVKISYYFCD
nr:SH3 domain-containing protein [uncultured Mucilaginibacter sp.]